MENNNINGYLVGLDYYDPINQAALQNSLGLGYADYLLGATIILPGNNWRVNNPGHFHIIKKK